MMKGRLYIDGFDAYKQFGVYVTDWRELLSWPPLKAVTTNDWQEEDGEEADLSSPVLNTREVSIKFAVAGMFSRFPAMLKMLSDGAYHDFDCAYIGRKFRLRLVSEGQRNGLPFLENTTLKFADDFPMLNYSYVAPSTDVMTYEDFLLDGNPFTKYGVRVLEGSLTEVKKQANVKRNLLRNINTVGGASYDNKNVTYKSKEVRLTCLLRADTLAELWRNYDAFLYDLIRPYEHVFRANALEEVYYCYYKQQSVTEFYPEEKIWLKFTVTLTFVGRVPFADIKDALDGETSEVEGVMVVRQRLASCVTNEDYEGTRKTQDESDDSTVLASEDDIIIFTEDGYYAIDIQAGRLTVPSMRLVNDRNTMRFTSSGNIRFNN